MSPNAHDREASPSSPTQGKNVLIWGVGGLGSWMAEYITRAGAAKVTVCDNGIVTGGLLVRQNYADLDIGASKSDRLADRLRAITPEASVESRHNIDDELQTLATTADLIIDATINRVVTRRLETVTNRIDRSAVLAQVATDARTGCLGIAMIYGTEQAASILEIDAKTGHVVEADPALGHIRFSGGIPNPVTSSYPPVGAPYPHSTDQQQTSQPSQPASQTSSLPIWTTTPAAHTYSPSRIPASLRPTDTSSTGNRP